MVIDALEKLETQHVIPKNFEVMLSDVGLNSIQRVINFFVDCKSFQALDHHFFLFKCWSLFYS
jgi:hypothetical protein